MPADKDLLYYNQTTAQWEGVHSGAISDGTNIITPSKIGVLSSLTTTDKTSTVAAINENVNKIGLLSSLTTTDKTSLVNATNEVKSGANTNAASIGTLANLTTSSKISAVNAINEVQSMPVNAMSRQAIINGNFDVWQRGTSFAVDGYTADRWNSLNFADGGTLPTITRSRQQFPAGFLSNSFNYYTLTFNGTGTSLGTNSYGILRQVIEYGTRYLCGAGKKITVSFYARSSIVGKRLGVGMAQSYGTGGSQSVEDVLTGSNFTLTSSFVKYTYTFSSVTLSGKTFGSNNDDSLVFNFYSAWGSLRQGSVGASTAETFGGSGTIDIAQVQVCAGDIALPFQPRSFADELTLCQRYYEKSYNYSVAPATTASASGIETKVLPSNTIAASQVYGKVNYKVKKRINTPTVTIYPYTTPTNTGSVSTAGGVDLAASTGIGFQYGDDGLTIFNNAGVQTTTGNAVVFHWASDAEL